ncbi:NAD(P)H-dependent oxidoreductase [Pedobacter sp. BMA]|uniref:NAD(P)H-dependent oxidoreductase n=1 Tax=Pedobacter sp. BMA TaxID=1663685 RepID=UPI00064B7568|nr:NAD(P)H-dependent oxidoreductase [Pedobacter sp. BMA]KLT63846.1 nitroreductase [Pedobacter sp. BMA]
MNLIDDLTWRYAVKVYNDQKVSEEKIDFILNAINLSASSCGLQPYRVFVVNNAELQAKLGADSFNKQIAQASHLLVFAAFNSVSTEDVHALVQRTAIAQEVEPESLDLFSSTVDGYFKRKTDEQNRVWAEKQTYIALGTALIAAATARVDATPMEGFNPQVFDELLHLKEKGLHSTVILSLGYRDEQNDYLSGKKKVRIPVEEMATKVY